MTVNPANRVLAVDADGMPGCTGLLVGSFGVAMEAKSHTGVGKGIGARSETLSEAGAAKASRPRARITVMSLGLMILKYQSIYELDLTLQRRDAFVDGRNRYLCTGDHVLCSNIDDSLSPP